MSSSPKSNAVPEPPAKPPMSEMPVEPRVGYPISDDSSEDEREMILRLEEEAGIFHNEEVVATPRNESDDDEPVRRFQLSHPGVHQKGQLEKPPEASERSPLSSNNLENVLKPGSPDDDFVHVDVSPMPKPGMERRMSVRFAEGFYESEEMKEKLRSPSPASELYMQALENPMSVPSDREEEFADLRDDPMDPIGYQHPLGSPPAYTSGDEGTKTPLPVSGGSSQSLGRHLNEIKIDFADRASQFENDSNHTDDEEDEDDDDDYTEDEIAVLTYIDQYKPVATELVPELHPFVIEYMAAYGEVDSFIKVPRPDEIDDNAGLTSLDEPPSDQSDAAIVDMQIRHATKDAAFLDDEVPVKILEKADERPDEIKKWIADIKNLHKSQPATTVHYKTKLPDTETLMQEWNPKLEEIFKTVRLPTAELDVSLEKYVDICLNILDIPVGKSRIEALHAMFSLFNEFSNSQHFRNLAQNNSRVEDSRERMDRLEL